MIYLGMKDAPEVGYVHERETLMDRLKELESDIGIVDTVFGKFVEDRLGTDDEESLGSAIDEWDRVKDWSGHYLNIVKACIRFSGKIMNPKDYMKEENALLLERLKPKESEESLPEEYNALMFMGRYLDSANAMGWVLVGHNILTQLESGYNSWVYEGIYKAVEEVVGKGVEDFEELISKKQMARWKRKGWVV